MPTTNEQRFGTAFRDNSGEVWLSRQGIAPTTDQPTDADLAGLPPSSFGLPMYYGWKELVHTGTFKHPTKKFSVSVDPERMDHWVKTFSRMEANGVKVFVPDDHQRGAADNNGWLYKVRREGDRLIGLLGVAGDEARRKVAANDISVGIRANLRDGDGNLYPDAIEHVALTPEPVVGGQQPVVELMSRSDATEDADEAGDADLSAPGTPHKYTSTQVQLPPDVAAAHREVADAIPDEELTDDGREVDPHVTVRYGLTEHNPSIAHAALHDGDRKPASVRLGKMNVFPATAERPSDVLHTEVESHDLHDLNGRLKAVDHVDTHPKYTPHCTIAYLKPGEGAKYVGKAAKGLTGKAFDATHVRHSDKDGNAIDLSLTSDEQSPANQAQSADMSIADVASVGDANLGGEGEPRDEDGKWTSEGGSEPEIGTQAHADAAGKAAREATEKATGPRGHAYAAGQHSKATDAYSQIAARTGSLTPKQEAIKYSHNQAFKAHLSAASAKTKKAVATSAAFAQKASSATVDHDLSSSDADLGRIDDEARDDHGRWAPNGAAVSAAEDVGRKAQAATAKATKSGSAKDHEAAAKLHADAAAAYDKGGNIHAEHERASDAHVMASKNHAAAVTGKTDKSRAHYTAAAQGHSDNSTIGTEGVATAKASAEAARKASAKAAKTDPTTPAGREAHDAAAEAHRVAGHDWLNADPKAKVTPAPYRHTSDKHYEAATYHGDAAEPGLKARAKSNAKLAARSSDASAYGTTGNATLSRSAGDEPAIAPDEDADLGRSGGEVTDPAAGQGDAVGAHPTPPDTTMKNLPMSDAVHDRLHELTPGLDKVDTGDKAACISQHMHNQADVIKNLSMDGDATPDDMATMSRGGDEGTERAKQLAEKRKEKIEELSRRAGEVDAVKTKFAESEQKLADAIARAEKAEGEVQQLSRNTKRNTDAEVIEARAEVGESKLDALLSKGAISPATLKKAKAKLLGAKGSRHVQNLSRTADEASTIVDDFIDLLSDNVMVAGGESTAEQHNLSRLDDKKKGDDATPAVEAGDIMAAAVRRK